MVNVENKTIRGESKRALLLWVLEELKDVRNALIKQQELIYKLEREEVKVEKELERVIEQLQTITHNTITTLLPGNSQTWYANIVRTPPNSPPSNV